MHSLAPYRISIQHEGKANMPLWDGKGNGLSVWMFSYFKEKLGVLEKRDGKRMTRVAKLAANGNQTFVCGRFQTGEYGFTSELVDVDANQVSHERGKNEAEMIPFFFSVAIPKQSTWGILTLQRFKNLGIHDFLVPKMCFDFSEQYPGARLVVEKLVPQTLVKALYDGALVKEMRFVSYKMPSAVEDALGSSGFEPHVDEVELVVKAKRKGVLPKIATIKQVISGEANLSAVATIPNWHYDALKLVVEVGGRRRTIDVGKPYKVTSNLDITEEVDLASDGHPDWTQIIPASTSFCEDLFGGSGSDVTIDSTMTVIYDAPKLSKGELLKFLGATADAPALN